MGPLSEVMGWLATPRSLAALVLLYGLLASQGGRGTLAYFTSAVTGDANIFSSGTVNISGTALTSGTSSPGQLTFNTDGIATSQSDCALENALTQANFLSGQRFTPGVFCVGKLSVANTSTIDAWMRLRLIRTSGADSGADLELNNKIKLYVKELTGTSRAADTCPSTVSTGFRPDTYAAFANSTPVTITGATQVNGLTLNTGLGISTNSGGSTAEGITSTTYADLIGKNAINGDRVANAGVSSSLLPAGVSRYFCVALHFPTTTSDPQSSTDNAAQGGADQYKIQVVAAQRSGRTDTNASLTMATQTVASGANFNLAAAGFADGSASVTAIQADNPGVQVSLGNVTIAGGTFSGTVAAASLVSAKSYFIRVNDVTNANAVYTVNKLTIS